MVYFVGAGSGAPDLITVRGARLLNQADQIIYAGSLVNPELLDYKKESAVVYDSAASHGRPLRVWCDPGTDGRAGQVKYLL